MIGFPAILRQRSFAEGRARDLFDDAFYRAENPDVARSGFDPFAHYLEHGWREGRDPAPSFSTLYYKDRYLARRPANPLLHYARLDPALRAGLATGPGEDALAIQAATIAPCFDADFYLDTVDPEGLDAVAHYLTRGWRQGFEPRPDFSARTHLAQHPQVRRQRINPFYHYVSTYPLLNAGRALPPARRALSRKRPDRPSPAIPADPEARRIYDRVAEGFDAAFYLARYGDVREARIDPVAHFLADGVREDRQPTELFWTGYYRRRYAAAIAPGTNPFLHYLSEGRARGFRPNPYGERLWPATTAPAPEAWAALSPAADLAAAEVVLIMPVYKGRDDTLAAIHSVLANRQATRFALLVIDDCSPDPALSAMLESLAGRGLFALLRNARNLGFVGTVNRGLAEAAGKDVVLLNADILVFGTWLDRLLRHAADPRVATITPFSNNATICSYPEPVTDNRLQLEVPPAQLDAFAAACNAGRSSAVPTGVGFCFYMRRSVIDAIGVLDAETFGRGYGEENDFCMRAAARGYRHLLAQDVFVFHAGSVSFGSHLAENGRRILAALDAKHPGYGAMVRNHIAVDPAREGRQRLHLYRFARALARRAERQVALLVTHGMGGGVDTHVRQLGTRLDAAGYDVVLLRIVGPTRVELALPEGSPVDFPVERIGPLSLAKDRPLCADALRWLAPDLAHVHSFVTLDWASTRALMGLIQQSCPRYYFTLHDYAPVCHRNHLVTPEHLPCGLPRDDACRACQRIDTDATELVDPAERRRAYGRFFKKAQAILSPSEDVLRRIERRIPIDHALVRPHEDGLPAVMRRAAPAGHRVLRVATIGAIGRHKGADLLHSLALDAQARDLPIAFTIAGYSCDHERMRGAGIWESGRYDDEVEALRVLDEERIDLVLLPAIWPETFSYTLSLALAAGVPPVVFDLGAPAERLKALGEGAILDPTLARAPGRLNDALLALDVAGLWARRKSRPPLRYARFPEDYYAAVAAEYRIIRLNNEF